MSLSPLEQLLLRAGAVMIATAMGAMALGRRWAKACDQRL